MMTRRRLYSTAPPLPVLHGERVRVRVRGSVYAHPLPGTGGEVVCAANRRGEFYLQRRPSAKASMGLAMSKTLSRNGALLDD